MPAAVASVPAKAPEILTNEIVPAPLAVVPIANSVVPTGEKLAEPVTDFEAAAAAPASNEVMPVVPVVADEILEPAASGLVVSEVPAVVAETPVSPVAAVAAAPIQQSSEEDDGPEGLIEGLVNTFTLEDGEGRLNLQIENVIHSTLFPDEDESGDASDELLRDEDKKKPAASDDDDDGRRKLFTTDKKAFYL